MIVLLPVLIVLALIALAVVLAELVEEIGGPNW